MTRSRIGGSRGGPWLLMRLILRQRKHCHPSPSKIPHHYSHHRLLPSTTVHHRLVTLSIAIDHRPSPPLPCITIHHRTFYRPLSVPFHPSSYITVHHHPSLSTTFIPTIIVYPSSSITVHITVCHRPLRSITVHHVIVHNSSRQVDRQAVREENQEMGGGIFQAGRRQRKQGKTPSGRPAASYGCSTRRKGCVEVLMFGPSCNPMGEGGAIGRHIVKL